SGALWQTMQMLRKPYDHILALWKKYGDVFTVPTLLGAPMVVTADPEGCKAIFTADPMTFVPVMPEMIIPVVGDGSLLVLGGERHARGCRRLIPPFHGARMRAYGSLILESAERRATAWPVGKAFNLFEEMRQGSLEVIMRAVFGVHDREKMAELSQS